MYFALPGFQVGENNYLVYLHILVLKAICCLQPPWLSLTQICLSNCLITIRLIQPNLRLFEVFLFKSFDNNIIPGCNLLFVYIIFELITPENTIR